MTLRSRRFIGQFTLSALLVILLTLHLTGVLHLGFVDILDNVMYDLKVQSTKAQGIDDRIVIVDIDDKSLQAEGRWPWPREKMARMQTNLFEQYGAAAVGFDIVFSEPDASSGLPVLERLAANELKDQPLFAEMIEQLRPQLDYDGLMAESLAKGMSVLGFYFNVNEGAERIATLPKPLFTQDELGELGGGFMRAQGYGGALPRLLEKATAAGFYNSLPDSDGVIRRMPVMINYQGGYYTSLPILLTRAAMGAQDIKLINPGGDGLNRFMPHALDIDGLKVPFDRDGGVLVPYRAPGAYRFVSATDVISGQVPASQLEGRIVLVGTTAPGLADIRVTPVSEIFPGVEIHASLLSGILDQNLKWKPRQVTMLTVVSVVILGLVIGILLPMTTPVIAATATLGFLILVIALDVWAWLTLNLDFPLGAPVITVLGMFVANMSYGFFVETRAKGQITKLFGQYVPKELVDEMSRDPDRYNLKGESREMSVLFSDIRDFTSISEGLSASSLAEMLNFYLSSMTRIVQQRRGTIDKYIGDAIMAFWGAPIPDTNHARDAVLAAMQMQTDLDALNPLMKLKGWPEIKIGIGVNSGKMSVGNMGSEFRMAYTVMADAVNLASRLEGLTKQYGLGILVGEEAVAHCPDIEFMKVDVVRVKGKQHPVTIYEPLGMKEGLDIAAIKRKQDFEQACVSFLLYDFDAAEDILRKANKRYPCKLYEVYLDRIVHFRENPPPADWDGVFTFTSK
ncbi:MAG: adenylate/guanylate cyclase domain-containing protein [Pseudomonadota bacterium]|nr:adenylate/guanylate cyclase domain-containing protein [Pseudomonadota bacterium]